MSPTLSTLRGRISSLTANIRAIFTRRVSTVLPPGINLHVLPAPIPGPPITLASPSIIKHENLFYSMLLIMFAVVMITLLWMFAGMRRMHWEIHEVMKAVVAIGVKVGLGVEEMVGKDEGPVD